MHVQFATVRCDEVTKSVFIAGSGTSEGGVRHPPIVAPTSDLRPPSTALRRRVTESAEAP
jgi:hypothetical protein